MTLRSILYEFYLRDGYSPWEASLCSRLDVRYIPDYFVFLPQIDEEERDPMLIHVLLAADHYMSHR